MSERSAREIDMEVRSDTSSVRIKGDPNGPVGDSKRLTTCLALIFVLFVVFGVVIVIISAIIYSMMRTRTEFIVTRSTISPWGYELWGPMVSGGGSWTDRQPMPLALSDMSIVASGRDIYIFGGSYHDVNGTKLSNQVFVFHAVNETYSTFPNMPRGRYRFCAALAGNLVVLSGGRDLDDNPIQEVDILDLRTKTWSRGPNFPFGGSDLCCAGVANSVYVFGGYTASYDVSNATYQLDLSASTLTWSLRATLPSPRGDCSATAAGSDIVVVGGWNNVFSGAVERFNTISGQWFRHTSLQFPRGDVAVTSYIDADGGYSIFVTGGESWSGSTRPDSFDINEIPRHEAETLYLPSPLGTPFVPKLPLPFARFRFASASVLLDNQRPTTGGVAEQSAESTTYANHKLPTVFIFGGQALSGNSGRTVLETNSVQAFVDTSHPNAWLHRRTLAD